MRIANDTAYGLSGGVWAADAERAKKVARRIRTGQIEVNGGAFNPNAPFGGYKQSGYGREYGAVRLRGVPRGQVHAAVSVRERRPGVSPPPVWSDARAFGTVALDRVAA